MPMNSHYLEVLLGICVFIGIIYFIIRFNRNDESEEIMPEMGQTDVLMEETENIADPILATHSTFSDEQILTKPRVISPEEAEEKKRHMRKDNKTQQYRFAYQRRTDTNSEPSSFEAATERRADVNTILVLYLMAPEGSPFGGYELHQALSSAGLTYGKMKIFHRYQERSEHTQNILFSVASAVNPGIIDLDQMGAFSTPGLSIFMDFKKQKNASAIFQMMLNTAKLLAEDLGAQLESDNKQAWSMPIELEYKRRIQQYNMQNNYYVGINTYGN